MFEITGIHYGYHMDVTTGPDGTATLTGLPVDSYEVDGDLRPGPLCGGGGADSDHLLGPA